MTSDVDHGVDRTKRSERLLADFVAGFIAGPDNRFTPHTGRIILSDRRIVLVTETWRTVVPVAGIADVAVGFVPDRVRSLFDDGVRIRYRVSSTASYESVVVGADADTILRFATALYRVLLSRTPVSVLSPARRGGVVTNRTWAEGRLDVSARTVGVVGEDAGDSLLSLSLSDVVHVTTSSRTVGSTNRQAIVVNHRDGDTVLTTELYCSGGRNANILFRLLRSRVREASNDALRSGATDADVRVLVAVHSLGPSVDSEALSAVFETPTEETEELLRSLREKRLLRLERVNPVLTPAGRTLVYASVDRTERRSPPSV